jgi:uncharacterized protein (DUF1499 family)
VVRSILVIIVIALAALLLYIRLAPSDPARWHTDPMTAAVPAMNGWLLRDGDGSAPSPVIPADPAAALAALDAVALATPRTTRLAGSPADGRITWVTRSRLMGFPDYTTATALADPAGARLVIFARQRFGSSDLGVNRARLDDWLSRLPDALSTPDT